MTHEPAAVLFSVVIDMAMCLLAREIGSWLAIGLLSIAAAVAVSVYA